MPCPVPYSMTRELPWLKGDGSSIPPKRQRISRPKGQQKPSKSEAADARRVPSFSSASSPVRTEASAPPRPGEFQPGLDGDDIYVMVEDEFLATAQTFTQHLHQAEYHRLRKQAIGRQQDRRPVADLQSMLDPVDHNAVPDEPWKGTQLQALMSQAVRHHSSGSSSSTEDLEVLPVQSRGHLTPPPTTAAISPAAQIELRRASSIQLSKGSAAVQERLYARQNRDILRRNRAAEMNSNEEIPTFLC